MPYNGSGIFNLTISLRPGTPARAEDVQAAFADLAAGLSNALTRDGQSVLSGPIDFGGYGFENVAAGSGLLPPGTPIPWLSANVPTGFLLAYGQILSQASQPGIFQAFGTQFNTGNEGPSNFRMPDLRGRILAGLDNMGGTAANILTGFGASGQTLGATGGEQAHALLLAELAAHAHTVTDPGHVHGVNDPGHNHNYQQPNYTNDFTTTGSSSGSASESTLQTGNSTTGVTVSSAKTGIAATDSIGSGTPHNIVQPTMLCNWIIKT